MNELLEFWAFIQEEFDKDLIEEFGYGINFKRFTEEYLAKASAEEIDDAFDDLINLYMDVSGTDNYGDVHDCLRHFIKDEDRIKQLLEEDDEEDD